MDQVVVLERVGHEESEVDAARDVARECRISYVPAPDRQPPALTFLKVTTTDHGPRSVAFKNPPPRVDVLPVARDVLPTREDEARVGRSKVEYSLGCARSVPLNTPGNENDKNSVAVSHGPLDNSAIVRCPRNNRNAPLEISELRNASLPTNPDDLISTVQSMLNHVLAEFPRRPPTQTFTQYSP